MCIILKQRMLCSFVVCGFLPVSAVSCDNVSPSFCALSTKNDSRM